MGSPVKVYTATEVRSIAQNLSAGTPSSAVGLDVVHDLKRCPVRQGSRSIRINLREGFDMSVFNLTKAEDTEQRSASEPCIAVSVILQGAGMGVIMNHSGSETAVPYRAGTTYVCVMQQKLEALMKVPAGAVFSGVDIRLSLDFFDSSGHCPT